ncbi:vomeronasal type-1 receptor 4-like [Suncus etruscus]|uniref:vomeronasal type-1 receptor 4-like n=1 Tax=Suncus etruscus TaxID=109475 RepID=UPI00210F3A49|nr:vomeronasal type-1 receptor 4-like [Suncus etruscus]
MDVATGIIILSETLLGALGNCSLLYHYLFLYCTEGRVRATDFILMHLTVSNSLAILSKGLPQTLAALGLTHFISDLECCLLRYVQRLAKCMSIGTTCVLSVFQAIMVSPMDSCCKDLKVKAPQYVTVSVSFCWILYVSVNIIFPVYILYISGNWSMINITNKRDLGYCYSYDNENVSGPVYLILLVLPELLFSVLIVWANGSMILFLYRHKQRVQHIHRNHVSSRSSAESRATQRILVLVSTFVYFYILASLFRIFMALFDDENWWLINTENIISLCFPTVSPFLVMRRDSPVFRASFAMMKNKKSRYHTPK